MVHRIPFSRTRRGSIFGSPADLRLRDARPVTGMSKQVSRSSRSRILIAIDSHAIPDSGSKVFPLRNATDVEHWRSEGGKERHVHAQSLLPIFQPFSFTGHRHSFLRDLKANASESNVRSDARTTTCSSRKKKGPSEWPNLICGWQKEGIEQKACEMETEIQLTGRKESKVSKERQ